MVLTDPSYKMIHIDYETEDLISQYREELELCVGLEDYKALVTRWAPASYDLWGKEPKTIEEIQEFLRGKHLERSSDYAGEEWAKRYGSLILPAYFMYAHIEAKCFKVPWGVGYLQIAAGGYFRGVDPEMAKQGVFKPIYNSEAEAKMGATDS